jgi:uncharacterized protein YraI
MLNRRIIGWTLAFMLMLLLTNAAFAQEASLQTTTTQRINLRAGPGVEWKILGNVDAGTVIVLDGRAPFDTVPPWVRGITPEGQIGWFYGENLAADPAQLGALREIWVDEPFTLTAPNVAPVAAQETAAVAPAEVPAAAPTAAAPPGPPPNYRVISNVGRKAREIYLRGQEMGNRPNIFSKVGDSITADLHFLYPIGWGTYNLRSYSQLQAVIDHFSTETARESNSFANPSLAAYPGWTTGSVLNPADAWPGACQSGETPLVCEYRLVKPSVALVMLGTNDVALLPADVFAANLGQITQTSIDMGVIPVLSTIPPRPEFQPQVDDFNRIIRETARTYGVPLWDFNSALRSLPNGGLWDGIHPSAPGTAPDDYAGAADLSPENLAYGYTVRNLTALQALDAVWRGAMY